MPDHPSFPKEDAVIGKTVQWLERAVIGLNLCPFAKAVHVKQQIRYVVSRAATYTDVLQALDSELTMLVGSDPRSIDTTLLVLPGAFADFYEFNALLPYANKLLRQRELEGVVQIASFHPLFQFAGSDANDIENYTNRAPYPILHLLREASVERAVDAFLDATRIYERNEHTMRALGHAGWHRLFEPDGERER